MEALIDQTIKKLGEGEIIKVDSGKTIFKLDSYPNNPVVSPEDIGLTWFENHKLKTGAVFNPGAELFDEKVILTPRCHYNYQKATFLDKKLGIERFCFKNYISEIWPLMSDDGINFSRFHSKLIRGDGIDHQDFTYGIEDIRIIKYGLRYLLVGCGKVKPPFKGGDSDRIAIYSTKDFLNISYHGIINSFDSRNTVPFSELVNGRHYLLLRFYPNIYLTHLEAGIDQLLNPSKYMEYWKKIYVERNHHLLLEAGHYPHEKEKIGPSTQVIKTERGFLFIYHAVGEIEYEICKAYGLEERIERGYSICAALLDSNDPRRLLCRSRYPIYIPSAAYELYGNERYPVDMPAVVFPTGAFVRQGKLIIYAGVADKYIILLSCKLYNLVNYLLEYCKQMG